MLFLNVLGAGDYFAYVFPLQNVCSFIRIFAMFWSNSWFSTPNCLTPHSLNLNNYVCVCVVGLDCCSYPVCCWRMRGRRFSGGVFSEFGSLCVYFKSGVTSLPDAQVEAMRDAGSHPPGSHGARRRHGRRRQRRHLWWRRVRPLLTFSFRFLLIFHLGRETFIFTWGGWCVCVCGGGHIHRFFGHDLI